MIRKCFCMREVGDIHVVVALGEENRRFRGILKLNTTAAFLYRLFDQECEPAEAARRLAEAYGIDSGTADAATADFVAKLERYGLFAHVA